MKYVKLTKGKNPIVVIKKLNKSSTGNSHVTSK